VTAVPHRCRVWKDAALWRWQCTHDGCPASHSPRWRDFGYPVWAQALWHALEHVSHAGAAGNY
jgi:hypothetical protein